MGITAIVARAGWCIKEFIASIWCTMGCATQTLDIFGISFYNFLGKKSLPKNQNSIFGVNRFLWSLILYYYLDRYIIHYFLKIDPILDSLVVFRKILYPIWIQTTSSVFVVFFRKSTTLVHPSLLVKKYIESSHSKPAKCYL